MAMDFSSFNGIVQDPKKSTGTTKKTTNGKMNLSSFDSVLAAQKKANEYKPPVGYNVQERRASGLAAFGIKEDPKAPLLMSQPKTLGGPKLGFEFTPLTQAPITEASKKFNEFPQTVKDTVRGGSFKETSMEVDHIVPKALGGTKAEYNANALLSTGTAPKDRQEGKMVVEWDNIEKFNKGQITQGEAIYNILQYHWANEESKKQIESGISRQYLSNTKISKAPEKSFLEKVTSKISDWPIFSDYRENEKARRGVADTISKEYNLDYDYAYKNLDAITKQLNPGRPMTGKEFAETMILAPVIPGLAFAPIKTIVALSVFGGVDASVKEAINLGKSIATDKKYKPGEVKDISEILPEDATRLQRDFVDLLGFIGEAALTHQVFKFGEAKLPEVKQKLTQDIITTYKLPQEVYIEGSKIKSIFQTGEKISPEELKLIQSLGLNGPGYRAANADGLSIRIPAQVAVTIAEKPYWSKLKKFFKLQPATPVTNTTQLGTTERGVAGLLGEPKPGTAPVPTPEAIKLPTQTTPAVAPVVKPTIKISEIKVETPTKVVREVLKTEAKNYKSASEFVKAMKEQAKSSKVVSEDTKTVSGDTKIVANEPAQASNLNPEEIKVQERISKEDFERIAERHFPLVKEFYADEGINTFKDYLTQVDARSIALEMDSYESTNKAIRTLLGDDLIDDVAIEDVVTSYTKGILRDKIQREEYKINVGKPTDVKVPAKREFYEPKPVKGDIVKIYETAKQKINMMNKKSVMKARKDLFISWATDSELASKLGVTPAQLNKQINTMTTAKVEAAKLQQIVNDGVPEQFQWRGITNSNFIVKNEVSNAALERVVGDINDYTYRFSNQEGKQMRAYITNTLLSIDTRLRYNDLNFKIDTLDHAYGNYDNSKTLISIDTQSLNTVAHEIGHYLDYRFARELGINNSLSDGHINYDALQKLYNLSDEHITWAKEFNRFVNNLAQKGEIGGTAKRAEYLQKPTEVFARFTAKFVDWTASKSGYHHPEMNYYQDKFSTPDYYDFIKLLQKKAEIDAKYDVRTLTKGKGHKINLDVADDAEIEDFFIKDVYPEGEAIKAPAKPKAPPVKQQLADREAAKVARQQAKELRASLGFKQGPEIMADYENQYSQFKKTIKNKNAEDLPQLEKMNKQLPSEDFNAVFYSQEMTGDEVFQMFKERYDIERTPLPKVPPETKGMVAERARQKLREAGKKTAIKPEPEKISIGGKEYTEQELIEIWNKENTRIVPSETGIKPDESITEILNQVNTSKQDITSTEASRAKALDEPVKMTTGELRDSAAYKDILKKLDAKNVEEFRAMQLAENRIRAIEFVNQDFDQAHRIARGLDTPPEGITQTTLIDEVYQRLVDASRFPEAIALAKRQALRGTRLGQEIKSFDEVYDENRSIKFINELLRERSRRKLNIKYEKDQPKAERKLRVQAEKINKEINHKAARIKSAQDIINSILC